MTGTQHGRTTAILDVPTGLPPSAHIRTTGDVRPYAVAALDGRQREVFALHCLAGYEISEVADMLGISSATVRVHLHNGRERLQEITSPGDNGYGGGECLMAKSDGADTPTGRSRSLFLLLRESGDALETSSPPFDVNAGEARLREAAQSRGLVRPDDILGKDLAARGASLDQVAPPFDVESGIARLRQVASARGFLSDDAAPRRRAASSGSWLHTFKLGDPV